MAVLFTSSTWNLQNILIEARGITGRVDTSMMSDAQMTYYANFYYQNVLPKELKIFWGYTYFEFFCQANIDQYEAPTNFQTFNPQVWADGWPIEWYLSPDLFYEDYPPQENKVVVATGDGTTNSFTFQIPSFPVIARSVYVTDGTQVAQDNGSGGFVNATPGGSGGPLVGTVNYVTGSVAGLVFPVPPAANTNIVCSSQTYIVNRPQSILFYRNQVLFNSTQASLNAVNMFVLRPIPDQVYKIKLQGIQVPPALISGTDVPFRPDLGPLIALGMSLHIFKVFNQMDQYEQYLPEYNRFKDVCMQDTYEELLYIRATPTF